MVNNVPLGVNQGAVAGPGVQPVSMNVSLASKASAGVTAGGGSRNSGYGY